MESKLLELEKLPRSLSTGDINAFKTSVCCQILAQLSGQVVQHSMSPHALSRMYRPLLMDFGTRIHKGLLLFSKSTIQGPDPKP
jgi:hypothetical protein